VDVSFRSRQSVGRRYDAPDTVRPVDRGWEFGGIFFAVEPFSAMICEEGLDEARVLLLLLLPIHDFR